MKNIKNIVLDFGGVIYKINEHLAVEKFRELSKYPDLFLKIIKNFNSNQIFQNYQNGFINSQEFRTKCKELFFLTINDTQFDKAWNSTLISIHPLAYSLINYFKKKFNIALLSNTNEIHYNYFFSECEPIFKEFDALFFSHLIHKSKPDLEIFNYTLKQMGFKSEQTLFIDDGQENIIAANSIGLQTLLIQKNNIKEIIQNFNIKL